MHVPPGITIHASQILYNIKWLQVMVVICFVIIGPRYKKNHFLSWRIVSVGALSTNKVLGSK